MVESPEISLEEAIYRQILRFPKRIDQMETRNEEVCRTLAREIVALVEQYGAGKSR